MNDHFVDAYRTAQRDYDDAVGELCKEARGLVNDGGSTTDLVRALGRVEHLDGMAKLALRHISDDWESRCMTVDQDPMMSKRAHMVRVKHPFIQAFFDFEKVALERFKIAAALEYVGEEIKNVSKQLRDEVR